MVTIDLLRYGQTREKRLTKVTQGTLTVTLTANVGGTISSIASGLWLLSSITRFSHIFIEKSTSFV